MKIALLALSLTFLQSSCTNRASSKFSGTSNPSPSWNVILTENNTIEEEYYTLGKIKATVKKNLLFFPNPTKKQVDEELIHKARLIGEMQLFSCNIQVGSVSQLELHGSKRNCCKIYQT